MGMRRKDILPEEGARVYQPQSLSLGQKLTIIGAVLLVIGLAVGGVAALKWKDAKEEAERLANLPDEPDYINQVSPLIDDMYCYRLAATLTGFPYKEFLPEACNVLTEAYTDFYIEGYVDVNETGYTLYGIDEEGERKYLTSFIFNSSGGYMDVGEYYSFFPDTNDVKDKELIFSQNMQQARYIDIPNSAFTDRDYLNEYLMSVFTAVKDSKDSLYASDVTKQNSYSLRFTPSVFEGLPDNTITKMFTQSDEEILSSISFTGDVGTCVIDAAFQQGSGIVNITILENTEKHEDSLVYSVPKDVLDNAVLQLISLHNQSLQEATEQPPEDNSEEPVEKE